MAKNSTEVYGAEGKSNLLSFDPDKLTLIEDPAHPLYDERVHLPLDEGMVRSIMHAGVAQPIAVWKDPETGNVAVVAGRQRVKNAREANRRLIEQGKRPIQVPGYARRDDPKRLAAIAVIENELRQQDTPLGRAKKMVRLQEIGVSDDELTILFNCSNATVQETLALLDCTKAVQNAVEIGKIKLKHAKALARLEPEEQRKKVEELVAAGEGARPHERARRQAAILDSDKPRARTKKEITKALETATGEAWLALRWVLGLEDKFQGPPNLPGLSEAKQAIADLDAQVRQQEAA